MMYGKAGLPAWLDVSFCPTSCPPSTPSVATLLTRCCPCLPLPQRSCCSSQLPNPHVPALQVGINVPIPVPLPFFSFTGAIAGSSLQQSSTAQIALGTSVGMWMLPSWRGHAGHVGPRGPLLPPLHQPLAQATS